MLNFVYGYVGIGFGALLLMTLLTLSVIDIKIFRLPDQLTLPLMAIGILQFWTLHHQWRSAVLGAVIGYGVFVAIEYSFKAIRGKAGLGRGDAKLLAAGGAWCGVWALPYIVLIASLTGIIFTLVQILMKVQPAQNAPNKTPSPTDPSSTPAIAIPFGPFLALGIFSIWMAMTCGYMMAL